MKLIALSAAFALLLSPSAFTAPARAATTDDVKWINQCVTDNKDEGAKKEVVLKYCTCMNNKMDNNETQSISTWEKTHKTEQAACSKEAGWK